jgi:diguanylate cyclase (GGDEF)-like protein
MLNVPTLWVTIIINFLAMGLVWAYVMRSYPKFAAAKFWAAASLVAALGAGITMLRGSMDPRFPLVVGGGLLVFACGIAAMGVRRFYDLDIQWRAGCMVAAASCIGLYFFLVLDDNMPLRMLAYSLGQSISIGMTLPLLLRREEGRDNPGARLSGFVGLLVIAVHIVRSIWALPIIGGEMTVINFNGVQAALMLAQVFLGMAWNFGFMLMAMDRLRNEVADLALVDDLTGVANRRHLIQRLTEECARSERSAEPFALLVIDLDGFKIVNDTYGHAAGDRVLQALATVCLATKRDADVAARLGGEEFALLLPETTASAAAQFAERLRQQIRDCAPIVENEKLPITVSIGIAAASLTTPGVQPLINNADQALYEAKRSGRNRVVMWQPPAKAVSQQAAE